MGEERAHGKPTAIVIAASSDIGMALAERSHALGWNVVGTYRTAGANVETLRQLSLPLVACDLSTLPSADQACAELISLAPHWDVLVLCPGSLEPVGLLTDCSFDAWEKSIAVNFTRQVYLIQRLLPTRRQGEKQPLVILFAGGGTNDAPTNYSAYTISKISLIKMCELLDAEVPDTRFTILGTGWVKTKIHQATFAAGAKAGKNYQRTLDKLARSECTPMVRVLDCCDWAVEAPRAVISGRNFSVANDGWGTAALEQQLLSHRDCYKLRRSGNDWKPMDSSNQPRRNSALDLLLADLPRVREQHAPASPVYQLLKKLARQEVEKMFGVADSAAWDFGPFGALSFPFFGMGAVDSLNLFDLDELILFSFYWTNRQRYRRAVDVGANIGLHSIVMSRCGFEVRSFEPDPTHYRKLQENLALNRCAGVTANNSAVSNAAGTKEFVRVLGNTTSSHLAGSKPSPYGELERFPVRVEVMKPLLEWADLVKMDVEGHEAEILLSTTAEDWRKTDLMMEVGSPATARAIFEHFGHTPLRMFAQKAGWGRVADLAAMPSSYKDGSLFLTWKESIPWE